MMRAVRRVGGVALVLGVVCAACGGPQEPADAGEDCYRDADCKPGLVCLGQGNKRVCSRDVSGLISQVERPPPDAGMPVDDGAAPQDDGAVPPDPADGG
ncbi:MAG TPA: hypothetical protein VF103_13005 [Polyangiaceae bacterium]